MELILGLTLLAVLILPPMLLAGYEVIEEVFINQSYWDLDKLVMIITQQSGVSMENENTVYDGMITVEIPVSEPQEVAYEPYPQLDVEVEIISGAPQA